MFIKSLLIICPGGTNLFKLAYITPIYKGGSKLKPTNYRPISLTSHVMKLFKSVLKIYIVKRLKKNNLLKGKSSQTQLLQHYGDVLEALSEGVRIETECLNFAKEFDKGNHDLLLMVFLSISKYIYLVYLMAFRYTWLPTIRVTSLSNLFSLITQAI